MTDEQRRALEAMGLDLDHAEDCVDVPEARRRAALALPLEMPREVAAGVLEMLRMCWAKGEPWDYDIQDQLAWWIWERYPGLYAESISGCYPLIFRPGMPGLTGSRPETDEEYSRRRKQQEEWIRESWHKNR